MGRTNLGIYGRRWLEEGGGGKDKELESRRRRWLEEGGGGKDKPWNLRKEVARRRRWWEGQTLESTEGGG